MNKKHINLLKKRIEDDKESSQTFKNWLLEWINNATKPDNEQQKSH